MIRGWFLLAVALTVPAQEIQERMEVILRNVRVHVTDREGKPVKGLTKADFQVTENGEPQEITYFEQIDMAPAPRRQVDLQQSEDTIIVENASPNVTVEAPPTERRAVIVFVDSSNMTQAAFDATVASLRARLPGSVREQDRFKLVQYDAGLRQLTGFTNDPGTLLKGLARMKLRAAYRRKVMGMNINLMGMITSYELTSTYEAGQQIDNALYDKGKLIAEVYKGQLLGLTGMARILEQIPGERSMMLFTGTGYRDPNADIGKPEVEKLAEDLSAVLNTADITLYSAVRNEPEPIRANTVDGTASSDFDTGPGSSDQADRSERTGISTRGETKLYQYQKKNVKGVIKPFGEMAAKQTGGNYTHIYKWTDFDRALDDFDQSTRTFYKIGYMRADPRTPGKVRVKLNAKRGLRLKYGKDFEGRLPYVEQPEDVRTVTREGMLLFGPPALEDLEAEWHHGVFRNGEAGYRIVVSGVVAGTDKSEGIELAFAALNRVDEPLDLTHITLTKEKGDAIAPFYDVLFVRDLPHKIRFYARDLTRDRLTLATQTVRDRISFPVRLSDLALAQPELLAAESLNKPIPGRANRATTNRYKKDPFRFDDIELKPLPISKVDASKPVGAWFHYYRKDGVETNPRLRFLLHAGGKARLVTHQVAKIYDEDMQTRGFLCVLNLPPMAAEDARLELVVTEPNGKVLKRSRKLTMLMP
ncbi:MAG: VWA domain-containing protein [Acidobacteriota bacterium]|nr:VWA domain-containing protein [Acidobacteriota bacterium]